jgi:putative flippase GtrA
MSLVALLTPQRRAFLLSAVKYGAAGVVNTLVGFSIIMALELGLHVEAHLANAAGYAVGVCVSFVLSRLFVFGKGRDLKSAGARYIVAVLAAFALNQLVLTLARLVLPPIPLGQTAAQAAAAVSYTGALFLMSHFWVFAAPKPARA